ncbi:MAG: molybdenum cofactor guanylyltransferase [Caulobacterales bacterium]|jgi:molybdopterin-guanine dinucleotide biosynthesis protein A|nr:molybdenum cofactor guanylyltransferase [Caulobacterales bacterium]
MDRLCPLSLRTAGLLLAGGRSSRFGAEKAVAPFGGGLMMDSVLTRFDALAACAVSARAGSAAAAHAQTRSLTVLYDAADAPTGPLAGVAAGLTWAKASNFKALATAPCDAPLLPLDIFPVLLASMGDAPAALAVTDAGEHPLCAVWRVEMAEYIAAEFVDGRHPPVRALLAQYGARRVRFKDAHAFANANTRDALEALERVA